MKSVKILHCVIDEKFIDGTIEIFDSIEGYDNEYVILNDNQFRHKYIKSDKVHSITMDWFWKHCIISNDYDIIILHSLLSCTPSCISRINVKIKVVWFSWGYDIYELAIPFKPLIELKSQIRGKGKWINYVITQLRIFKRFAKGFLIKGLKTKKDWINSIKRIDYYSGVYPEEFELLKRNHRFKAQKIQFNYISKQSPIKIENQNDFPTNNRTNIMIGHQANPLLNHTECMHLIKKMGLSKHVKIICPLSYGAQHDINRIKQTGEKLFGNQFIPLINFLPFNEYSKIYNNINVAIYDIKRQCAVGNILMALWDGVKVFLPEHSMNYKHFKNLGIIVYSIEQELNLNNISNQESIENIKHNRDILLKFYSYNEVRQKLINSLQLIS